MDLRPEVIMADDWITEVVSFYFWMDHPYNLFPSMHLAASFFAAFYCLSRGRIIGWTAMAMAVIVAVSVVLLKQHYIMDVVAGFLVGWFCSFFSMKQLKTRLSFRNAPRHQAG
jgi:membrane-associated phospholipid phosphatase